MLNARHKSPLIAAFAASAGLFSYWLFFLAGPSWSAARNTITVSLNTCLWSVLAGSVVAFLLTRTDMPLRRLQIAVLAIMVFVPIYLQAAAWEAGFGRQGWVSYARSGLDSPLLQGTTAVVWIHGLAAIPWVVGIVALGLRGVEPELEECALLEMPVHRVIVHVTMRRALTSIVIACLWTIVMTSTDMTVTDIYQVRTYAEELYVGFALGDDLTRSAERVAAGAILVAMLVAMGFFIANRIVPRQHLLTQRPQRQYSLGAFRWLATMAVSGFLLVLAGVPLGNLIYKTGLVVEHQGTVSVRRWASERMVEVFAEVPARFGDDFRGTILIGVATATLVTTIAAPLAWRARSGGWRASPAMVVVAAGLAVPGPLIALTIIALLNRDSPSWMATLYDRTITAPVAALTIRILPLPILGLWYSFRTIPTQQLEAVALEGAGTWTQWVSVVVPQRWPALLGAWLAAFALATGDLASCILVVPPGFDMVATRIFLLVHAGVDDQVAALCLANVGLYVVCSAVFFACARALNRFRRREQ